MSIPQPRNFARSDAVTTRYRRAVTPHDKRLEALFERTSSLLEHALSSIETRMASIDRQLVRVEAKLVEIDTRVDTCRSRRP